VIYTRTAGAVRIVARPSGWLLTTMAGQQYEGATAKSGLARQGAFSERAAIVTIWGHISTFDN
jgi:hypothetical protein